MKALHCGGILIQRQETIDETRHHVRAQGQASRPVVLLLSLEPGPLEKRFMPKDVGRRTYLTEKPLRCVQGASFR
jgi:hypothetical protein